MFSRPVHYRQVQNATSLSGILFALLGLTIFTLFVLNSNRSWAASPNNKIDARCENLTSLPISEGIVLRARVIAAHNTIPRHCNLLVQRRPNIHIALLLPLTRWNEKLAMLGCNGFCGKLVDPADRVFSGFPSSPFDLLARGYAVTWSDSGHWGQDPTDGLWAQHNRQAEINWGYRAIHATIKAAKEIISEFHKEDLRFTYFAGCGDGGRQALMAAQHYPHDFDGVLAGSPVLSATSIYAAYYSRLLHAHLDDTGQPIDLAAKLPMLIAAVRARCDRQDGSEDGVIAQPDQCDFDLAALSCDKRTDESCLTELERSRFEQIYDPPTNELDKLIYPSGPSFGSEEKWSWFLTQKYDPVNDKEDLSLKGSASAFALHQHFLRYLAFEFDPGVNYNILDFDVNRDFTEMEAIRRHIDVGEPRKLAPFIKQGGRLLITHGWQDTLVPPSLSRDYVRRAHMQMEREMLEKGVRLYLVPGFGHCRGDSSAESPPFLTMLEAWVERHELPDLIMLPPRSESKSSKKQDPSLENTAAPIQLCPYSLKQRKTSNKKNKLHCTAQESIPSSH